VSLNVEITPIDSGQDVITLQEAKEACNVDVDTFDTLFVSWIAAARCALEMFTNVAFLPSRVTIKGRNYSNYIEISFPNNAELTGESANKYSLSGDRIYTTDRDINIEYTAGDEPKEWMKQAVKMYVADLYKNRGESLGELRTEKILVGERAKQYCKAFINHGMMF